VSDEGRHYKVQRLYFNRPGYRRTIIDRCTLEEAQRHCSDPETSSSTATSSTARARTRRMGPWFDSYTER
jgi:hypothetical protein